MNNQPIIFGLDTSGVLCSMAWRQNSRTLMEVNMELPQMHATLVAGLFEEGMAKLNLSAEDISLVAVGTGPGSYTGLRIGMSFSKGFCFGTACPIVGISGFDILESQSPRSSNSKIVMIDAHKNRYYMKQYSDTNKQAENSGIYHSDEIREMVDKNTGIVLDYYALDETADSLAEKSGWVLRAKMNAGKICELAEQNMNTGQFDDLETLEPVYLQAFAGVL